MNKNTLFNEAMTMIDDGLIVDSVRTGETDTGRRRIFISIAATAAAAGVIIPVAVSAAHRYANIPGSFPDTSVTAETAAVTSDEIAPGIDPVLPDTDPVGTEQLSSDPDIYLHPTVEELRERNDIGSLVPVHLPDGYVFAPINLLTVNDEFLLCNAYLIDNRNKVIERAEREYGTGQMAAVYGNVSWIYFSVAKKRDGEILTITAEGSLNEYSETVEIKEDYSKYIGFNDLSPKIIEESRTECFDYDPAMRGYMYEVFLDAGEYKVHYRYALCGDAEPLSAEELYSVIMSCEYRG